MLNQVPTKSNSHFEEHASNLLIEEKCASLYGNLPASIAISFVIAVIISIAHWDAIGHAEVIIWNLILGGALVARLITWAFWNYTRQAWPDRLWIALFRAQVWLAGIAWGLSTWFLFSHESTIHQALLAFSIAGVASGSLTSLTIDRLSAIGFVILTVFPLSLTLYQQSDTVAFYMLIMSILFMFFVISSTNRAQGVAEDRILKNIELTRLANELRNKQFIENIIKASQSRFIQDKNSISALHYLLEELLKLSGSSIGFIGKINYDDDDKLYMKALTFAGEESVEKELMRYYAEHLPPGGEFHNLNNLFGSAIESGKSVISNSPARDLRSGGIPPGHPKLNNFIALPIYIEGQKIALLGLANSKNGYGNEDIEQLEPVLNTIAQLVQVVSNEEDHARDKAALVERTLSSKIVLDNVSDGIITIDRHGKIQSFNRAAETIFGYKQEKILHKNVNILMSDNDRNKHPGYIKQYLNTYKGNIIDKGREVIGQRKNGETFPMDLFVSMVVHNDEPMFIGVIRDISEVNKSRNQKDETLKGALKELVIQQIGRTIQKQLTAAPSNTGVSENHEPAANDNLYRLLTRHFFIDNRNPRVKIYLGKKLKEITSVLAHSLRPIPVNFSAEDRRNNLLIECDEILLDICLYLLANNLLGIGLDYITINIFEEKSMAKIVMEAGIRTSLSPEQITEKLFSVNGHRERNAKDINSLLMAHNGKIQLDKLSIHQLAIEIEFPQTIAH